MKPPDRPKLLGWKLSLLRGTYGGYCANVYPWDGAVHALDAMHAVLVL